MEASSRNFARVGWLCLAMAAVAGATLLYWFNPERAGFYPVCIFYKTTGWRCPGCGGLRAIHQLLHGHLAAAFEFNPLVVAGLPFSVALCLRWCVGRVRHRPVKWEMRPAWIWAGFALLLLFGIGRNL